MPGALPWKRSEQQSFRSRSLLLGGALLTMALIAAGLVGTANISRRSAAPAAPGFVLSDQQGRLTSLAQFRGKVVVLTFIDPECTQICPLTTRSMVEALKLLGPAAASKVELLGVNINAQKNGSR